MKYYIIFASLFSWYCFPRVNHSCTFQVDFVCRQAREASQPKEPYKKAKVGEAKRKRALAAFEAFLNNA